MINKIKAYYRLFRIRKTFKLKTADLYNSIDDLPTWNYYQVIEQSDLKYLAKVDDYSKPFKYNKRDAYDLWTRIDSEFINAFGVSREQQDLLLLEMEMAVYYYEWKVEKIFSSESYYVELKKQYDSIIKATESNPSDLQSNIFYIEREMGFKVDEKELPIKKFMLYVKELNKIAKKLSQNGKKAEV